LCGAHMTPRPIDVSADLPGRLQLRVRMERVAHITALEVSLARAVEILDRLGFDPRAGQGTIDVRVPTTRFVDVTREIDVIEEIARIYGLEHVPSVLSVGSGGGLTAAQRVRRTVADACLGAGLTEAQTLSYVPADTPDRLGLGPDDPRRTMLAVANPLSQDHSHLRTLLLPSLLEALARNASWGRDDLALFEIAHTYHPVEGQTLPREPWTFGAVMRGRLGGAAWRRAGEPASFFLGKGVLESILGAVGVTCRVNGVTKQDSRTQYMYFKIPRLIAELSAGMTLEAGDVISTGTPAGVGYARTPPEFLRPGDLLETEVEGIGTLRNTIG